MLHQCAGISSKQSGCVDAKDFSAQAPSLHYLRLLAAAYTLVCKWHPVT